MLKYFKKILKVNRILFNRIRILYYDKIHIHFTLNKKPLISFNEIRNSSVEYINSQKISSSTFSGYKYSDNTKKPCLYCTVSSLLLKHLLGIKDEQTEIELQFLLSFQDQSDGLFKDPVISCREAETMDWWGWKHLTLHALNALALYEVNPFYEINYLKKFDSPDKINKYLNSLDWGVRAPNTSNAVQNIGTLLQYSRDYLNKDSYNDLLNIIYEKINKEQDIETGLFGINFNSPKEISHGIQAGYHFWTLYFYDDVEILHKEKIIDNLLRSQNKYGGYDFRPYSGACADIDTIDPLVKFSLQTEYRKTDIISSLQKAIPNLMTNKNSDGGWVYRKNEAKKIIHEEMYSRANVSNTFYTWWRVLSLAYSIKGIELDQGKSGFPFIFKKVPGLQFLND